jgi:hypothetical protein
MKKRTLLPHLAAPVQRPPMTSAALFNLDQGAVVPGIYIPGLGRTLPGIPFAADDAT